MKNSIISLLLLLLPGMVATQNVFLYYKKAASGINCKDGEAIIRVQGGFDPYKIAWSGPNGFSSNLPNIDHLGYGQYTVTVTDALCGTATLEVNIGIKTFAYISSITNPEKCNEGEICTGKINIVTTESMGPYSYKWSGPSITSANISNRSQTGLCKGDYFVTVTSGVSCAAPQVLFVHLCCCQIGDNPYMPLPGSCYNPYNLPLKPLEINVANAQNPTKLAGTVLHDGAILINAEGGTVTSYTYNWTGPNGFNAGTEDISGLDAGTYTVTVSDGCQTATKSITLSSHCDMEITAVSEGATCAGGHTGAINITSMSNGQSPYLTSWTNGTASGAINSSASLPKIQGLASGEYQVTVTDAHNCSVVFNSTIVASAAWADNPFFRLEIDPDDQCFNSIGINAKISIDCAGTVVHHGSNFSEGHVEHGSHTVVWPDMTTTVIVWSSELTDAQGGFWDLSCEYYGITDFDVDVAGSYNMKVLDNNGCTERFSDHCFSFGNKTNVFQPFSERKPYPTPAITSCVTCSSCGGNCGGNDHFDCNDENPTKLVFSPTDPYNPCSGGGAVSACVTSTIVIPDYVIGIPFIDLTSKQTVGAGVCQYNVGCYFPEGTLEDAFFNSQPAYLETTMLVSNPDCKPSDELYMALEGCLDGDYVQFPYHQVNIVQGEGCGFSIFCDEINEDGSLESRILIYSSIGDLQVCYKENGFGSCDRITKCLYTEQTLKTEENVICDYSKLCVGVRPGSNNIITNNRDITSTAPSISTKPSTMMTISPNPYQDGFTIKTWADIEHTATIVIADVLGRVKLKRPIALVSGDNEIAIAPLENFQDGLYFVLLVENGVIKASSKVLQQH